MTTLQFQLIVIGLLAVIAAGVGLLALRMGPRRLEVGSAFMEALQTTQAAVTHHVEVAAVLEIIDQLAENPKILPRLGEYADEVVAAALLFRLNSLGNILQKYQQGLETYPSSQHLVESYTASVERVLGEMQAVRAMMRKLGFGTIFPHSCNYIKPPLRAAFVYGPAASRQDYARLGMGARGPYPSPVREGRQTHR